jgi:CheY-like chemotaxis protein
MTSALLVAEASEARTVLSRELCNAGYSVTIVATSREAGMLLKIGFPDLLVWWVGKPTVDDLRLARAVKDREANAPLPVIYVNGVVDAQRLADKLAGLRG